MAEDKGKPIGHEQTYNEVNLSNYDWSYGVVTGARSLPELSEEEREALKLQLEEAMRRTENTLAVPEEFSIRDNPNEPIKLSVWHWLDKLDEKMKLWYEIDAELAKRLSPLMTIPDEVSLREEHVVPELCQVSDRVRTVVGQMEELAENWTEYLHRLEV